MNHRFFQAGAMLAGAAVIAAAMAVNPATAHDVAQFVKSAAKVVKCNSSTACSGGTNSGNGPGVQGTNLASGDGVDGYSNNNNGVGAVTYNPSATNGGRSGLFGVDSSTDGGAGNVGVTGLSVNGTGVRGQSTYGFGVAGWSTEGGGLFGLAGGEAPAIEGVGGTSNDSSGLSLVTYQASGKSEFWVTNDSNAHVNGLIYTNGNCSKGCDRTRGERIVSYAAQTSAPMLEDVGESQLSSGRARVAIDASLARAIDQGAPYVVFVTPEGQSHGLYVTDKTPSGFAVVENDGGRSSIPFGYRIVAKPYGVNAARLPVVTAAQMPRAVMPNKMRMQR
jgi:hypothetical protein